MRRAFFFIVAVCLATSSFASITRTSIVDPASSRFDRSSETRVGVFDALDPFERPVPTPLNRALHQAYAAASTTNASGLSRFLSVDPVITKAAIRSPQLWNRYAYVANNPMNRVDPDGRLLQLSACVNGQSNACTAQYNLYLSTFGNQAQNAAKYLQVGKNGIVSFNGISGNAFAAKFGMMGRASNYLISNRASTFEIFTRSTEGGANFNARAGGGGDVNVDTTAFPRMLGGVEVSATEALAHELGHAVSQLVPGYAEGINEAAGRSMLTKFWPRGEGYATTFENGWRRSTIYGPNIGVRNGYFENHDVRDLGDVSLFP